MADFPVAATGFSWVIPTENTDNSPITAGEIASYNLGIRTDGDAAHGPGNYTINVVISDPTATSEALTALGTVLAPGNYWAAIKVVSDHLNGRPDSAYSPEVGFSVAVPVPPTPMPPGNFSVA